MISGNPFVDGADGGALAGNGIAAALVFDKTGGLRKRLKFVTPKTVS